MIKVEKGKLAEDVFSEKTNRMFKKGSGIRSLTNHLRYIYGSMEDAYRDLFNLDEPPPCPFCEGENRRRFDSVTKGYKKTCGSESCLKKSRKQVNARIAVEKKKEGYDEWILENLEKVRDLFLEDIPYFDDFHGKEMTNKRIVTTASPSSLKDERFLEDKKCIICDKDYKDFFYSTRGHYCSESCAKKYSNFCRKKVDDQSSKLFIEERKKQVCLIEETNDLYEFSKLCKDKRIDYFPYKLQASDPIKGIIFRTIKNSDCIIYDPRVNLYCGTAQYRNRTYNTTLKTLYLGGYLTDEQIEALSFIIECYQCKVLHKKINFALDENTFQPLQLKDNNSKNFFCSPECYYATLKDDKNSVYPITPETKKKISEIAKRDILEGKRTPNSNNRLTHGVIIDGQTWRSSWEYVFYLANKLLFDKNLTYEKTRIPYINEKGVNRVYITDFTDENDQVVYEVGPKTIKAEINEKLKIKAAEKWCTQNGYTFKLITEDFFKNKLTKPQKAVILDFVRESSPDVYNKVVNLLE